MINTQSDMEKAEAAALKSPFCNNINGPTYTQACDAYRDGYLAGAEAKDLEWQAKVQGLVAALEHIKKRDPACSPCREYNTKEHDSEIAAKALAQFTSGQPAKGVLVEVERLRFIEGRLKSAVGFEPLNSLEPRAISEALGAIQAIRGIEKDL